MCFVCVYFIHVHFSVFSLFEVNGVAGWIFGTSCIVLYKSLLKHTLLLYRLFCIPSLSNLPTEQDEAKHADIWAVFRLKQSDQKSPQTADGQII